MDVRAGRDGHCTVNGSQGCQLGRTYPTTTCQRGCCSLALPQQTEARIRSGSPWASADGTNVVDLILGWSGHIAAGARTGSSGPGRNGQGSAAGLRDRRTTWRWYSWCSTTVLGRTWVTPDRMRSASTDRLPRPARSSSRTDFKRRHRHCSTSRSTGSTFERELLADDHRRAAGTDQDSFSQLARQVGTRSQGNARVTAGCPARIWTYYSDLDLVTTMPRQRPPGRRDDSPQIGLDPRHESVTWSRTSSARSRSTTPEDNTEHHAGARRRRRHDRARGITTAPIGSDRPRQGDRHRHRCRRHPHGQRHLRLVRDHGLHRAPDRQGHGRPGRRGVAHPSSDQVVPVGGGSFQATYNGSTTYNTDVSPCEPLEATKLTPRPTTAIHADADAATRPVAHHHGGDGSTVTTRRPSPAPLPAARPRQRHLRLVRDHGLHRALLAKGTVDLDATASHTRATPVVPVGGGSFQATYNGSTTYNTDVSPCEPLRRPSPLRGDDRHPRRRDAATRPAPSPRRRRLPDSRPGDRHRHRCRRHRPRQRHLRLVRDHGLHRATRSPRARSTWTPRRRTPGTPGGAGRWRLLPGHLQRLHHLQHGREPL